MAICIIVGLALGSFINALVWRLHEQGKARPQGKAKSKPKSDDLSITKGRSMCIHCHHTLAWYDLIPVISWLTLRGRCRYCSKPIGWQYPVVELATAILFALSYKAWDRPLDGANLITLIVWLGILVGLLALFVYDLRWMMLPNRIIKPLASLALLYALVTIINADSPLHALIQVLLAVLVLGGLFWALFQISGGNWIGGGDVKLGFVLGLLAATPVQAVLLLFLASVLGTLVAIPLMVAHKAKTTTRLPFGPFLITACVVVVLYGQQIITWYNHLFLIN